MSKPTRKPPEHQSIEDFAKSLSPEERARISLEVWVETLTQEAVATSAIEGIIIDPKEARKAVLRYLGRKAGLL